MQDLRDPILRARFKLSPDDFPRFLWEGETMDDEHPTIGFLCHPILFAVSVPTGISTGVEVTSRPGSPPLCNQPFKRRRCHIEHVNEARVHKTMWRQTRHN